MRVCFLRDLPCTLVTQELVDDFSSYARQNIKPVPTKTPVTGRKRSALHSCCKFLAVLLLLTVRYGAGVLYKQLWRVLAHQLHQPQQRSHMRYLAPAQLHQSRCMMIVVVQG